MTRQRQPFEGIRQIAAHRFVGNSSDTDANLAEITSVRPYSDGSVHIGNDSDYSSFDSDGVLRFYGDAVVWADIDFPIIIRTTGVGIPSLATFNGNITMPQWAVNDFNACESQEFIHEWDEGTECHWHLHLNTNGSDTDNRYVRFDLEYGYSEQGVWTFPAVVDTGDILIPANTPTKKQIIMSLATFTPTNAKIADHAIARLKRIASTGAAPTGNPFIPMLQMHVKKNTAGSRQITTK